MSTCVAQAVTPQFPVKIVFSLTAHEVGAGTIRRAEMAYQAHGDPYTWGVTAALTPLPVIGVPIESKSLKGLDSLLSIVQMPSGIPVATVGIGGARNAGLLATAGAGGAAT